MEIDIKKRMAVNPSTKDKCACEGSGDLIGLKDDFRSKNCCLMFGTKSKRSLKRSFRSNRVPVIMMSIIL